jgi:hypothetical protein
MLAGVLVAAGRGGWWPCGRVGTARRGMVDRQATTLLCAGWDRRSAIRRKLPLTRDAAGGAGGQRTLGGRSCDGGARRVVQISSPPRPIPGRGVGMGLAHGSSRPPRTRRARGRSRPRPGSWRSWGQPGGGTARTGAAGLPRPARSPAGPGLAAARRSGCRHLAGAGRTRADSTSWARSWVLPALVRCPRTVRWPLECSLGTSPQSPMSWLAGAKRRQSPTSAASVRAPSRVTAR